MRFFVYAKVLIASFFHWNREDEGNTEKENSADVVFKENIHNSDGKY